MAFFWQVSSRLFALQHRDFRLFWADQMLVIVALQMQTIAVNWQVYTLLKDTTPTLTILGRTFDLNAGALGLGALGLIRWLPILVFGLAGGILADSRNRRRILIATQIGAALLAALLAFLTWTDRATVLAIYVVVAVVTALSAVEGPARESLIPNLVPRRHLTNAVSLTTMTTVLGTIIGPVVAGAILATGQIGAVYALQALIYLPALAALTWMRYTGEGATRRTSWTWSALAEGFRFTFATHMIRSTMLVDFFATLLGSARTLLPIVADQVLGIGAGGYGLLATAQPLGSLLAGTTVALRRDIYRQGAVFLICIALYGLGTALFGVSTVFAFSYLLFGITGAADTVSSIIRGAIRQMWTPDALRGRMVGVNMIFYMGGPQLGEVRAGLVAAALGAPVAIISGGLAAALLAGWAAWRDARLRSYTAQDAYAAGAQMQPTGD